MAVDDGYGCSTTSIVSIYDFLMGLSVWVLTLSRIRCFIYFQFKPKNPDPSLPSRIDGLIPRVSDCR